MQQDSATTVAQGMISQFSVALIINQKCDKQTKNFLLLRLQHIISISLLYASLHSVPLTIKTKKGYKKIKQSLVSSIINQKYSKQSKTSFSRLQNRISISLFRYVFLPSVPFLEHMELLVVQVLPPSQYHPTTYNSERKFPIVKVESLKIKRVSVCLFQRMMRFPANFHSPWVTQD